MNERWRYCLIIAFFYGITSICYCQETGGTLEVQKQLYQELLKEQGEDSAIAYMLDFSLRVLRHNVDTAILAYEWASSEIEQLGRDSTLAYCLGALQYLYRISGQFEKGVEAAGKERRLFQRADDSIAHHIDNYLGLLYDDWGKYDSAQVYLKRYYLDNKISEHPPGVMTAANNLGRLYSHLSEFELAIQYYSEALEKAEFLQDTATKGYALHNLGSMFLRMENIEVAEQYLERAISWTENAGMESILTRTRFLLAKLLVEKGALEQAEKECLEAQSYFEALKIYPKMVEGYQLLAQINHKRGHLNKARSFLERAADILDFVDQVDLRIEGYVTFATLLVEQGDDQQALNMMQRALNEGELNQRNEILPQIYEWFYEYYLERRIWKQSAEWAAKARQARAKWEAKKQTRLVYEMQSNLALARKDQEIKSLHALQQEQVKRVTLQRKLNIALAGLLLGALCFLGFTLSSLRKSKIIAEQQEKMHQQEITMKDQERNLSVVQALVEGQESERKRVATELHDGLGALLAGIRLKIQSLSPQNGQHLDRTALDQVEQSMVDAYEEVRRISHDMMPGVLAKYGLVEAIENLNEHVQENSKVDVEFQLIGNPIQLSDTCNIMIYRIFQELINNSLKHADASQIYLQLSFESDTITLMMEDDGKGFDLQKIDKKNAIGLKSLESRVKFLKGTMEVDTQLGRGTSIMIHFPRSIEKAAPGHH